MTDWTEGPDGVANSSRLYLELVDEVAYIVSTARVGSNPEIIARNIVSHLAHRRGLHP